MPHHICGIPNLEAISVAFCEAHFSTTVMNRSGLTAEEKTKSLLKLFKKVSNPFPLHMLEGSPAGGRNSVYLARGGECDSAGGKERHEETGETHEEHQGPGGGGSSSRLEEGKEGYARDFNGAASGRVREEQGYPRERARDHANDGGVLPRLSRKAPDHQEDCRYRIQLRW